MKIFATISSIFLLTAHVAYTVKRQLCNVDFSGGMSDGQLVIDRRAEKRANCEAANADIVYEMDEEKCKHLLLALLSSAR